MVFLLPFALTCLATSSPVLAELLQYNVGENPVPLGNFDEPIGHGNMEMPVWETYKYSSLLVDNTGSDNILYRPITRQTHYDKIHYGDSSIKESLSNLSVLFQNNATLQFLVKQSSDEFHSAFDIRVSRSQNMVLDISGDGNLLVQVTPSTTETHDPKNFGAFYVGSGIDNGTAPSIKIGDENNTDESTINLNLQAIRGIVSEGGSFNYNCKDGEIKISGGFNFTGFGESDIGESLIDGIAAHSSKTALVDSTISIVAKNISIFFSGENRYPSYTNMSNKMIATEIAENSSYPDAGEVTSADTYININANNYFLLIGESYSSPKGGYGIYSQSGKYFESIINLSGDSFLLRTVENLNDPYSERAAVNLFYGLYMYDNGSPNHVNLNFDTSVVIDIDSTGYGVYGLRRKAASKEMTTLSIHADDSILISNQTSAVAYNVGEVFTFTAPTITMNSGGYFTLWTSYLNNSQDYAGSTTIEGETISIVSTGTRGSSYAIATTGNPVMSARNGETDIQGNTITISSDNIGALFTQYSTASVAGTDVAITSQNGYAVGTFDNSIVGVSGNNVSIRTEGQGTEEESFAVLTDENSVATISGNTVTIIAPNNFALGTTNGSTATISGTSEVTITSSDGYAVTTSYTSTAEISGGTVSIGSTNDNSVYTSSSSSATINGNVVTVRSDNAGTILTESSSDTTVTAAQVNISSGTDFAIKTSTAGTASVSGDIVLITNGDIEEVTIETVPNTIPYVIGTMDSGSTTNVNYDNSTETTVGQTTLIAGRVLSYNSGATNIGMNSDSSLFVGSTDDGAYFQDEKEGKPAFGNLLDETTQGNNSSTAGAISIYGGNGSTWIVKPNPVSIFDEVNGLMNQWSNLSKYQSNGFSVVDLTTTEAAQDLNIGTLTGNSASFRLRTYIDEQRITGGTGDETQTRDHVNLLYGNGQHFIVLSQGSTGIGVPYLEQFDYLVWSREPNTLYILNPKTGETEGTPGDDNLSFKLGVINEGGVDELPYVEAISKIDMGIYNYFLTTRDRAHDGIDMEGIEFFLSRGEGRGPDGGPDYSPSTDLDRTLAGFGGVYAIWWAELSDLRKRLGEVRYGAQDGAWAKVLAQKDDIAGVGSGRFTQKLYAVNLGIDHMAVQSEDRMWLLGGNFKYANANQRIKHSRYGKGDIHNWGMNLYATYANQYGCYSDLVLTYDHYKRKVNSRMLDNTPVGAKWNNYGLGISLEIGKMFSSTQDDEGWGPWYNHWWIEPQAQLAYYWVHGKGFTLSNGLQAKQGNTDFLTGRLGVVIGKKFNYGKDRAVVDKRYSQFYIKGGIKHEFLGNQKLTLNDTANEVTFKGTLRGTRVYYGGGFDWNFTDQLRLYAQIERENGGKYKKDYEVSVGLRWQF